MLVECLCAENKALKITSSPLQLPSHHIVKQISKNKAKKEKKIPEVNPSGLPTLLKTEHLWW